jgi:hypothetical protein
MIIGIAKCCPNCAKRNDKAGTLIECKLHGVMVPQRGYCGDYKQTENKHILAAERNMIKDLVKNENSVGLLDWMRKNNLLVLKNEKT